MSMQVQQPTADKACVTKMSEGKVFVVYYGAGKEIDALFREQIMHRSPCMRHGHHIHLAFAAWQWDSMQLPIKYKKGKLLKALQSAEQAIANGAVV